MSGSVVERRRVGIDVIAVVDFQRDDDLIVVWTGFERGRSADVVRRLGDVESLACPPNSHGSSLRVARRGELGIFREMKVESHERGGPDLRMVVELTTEMVS